MVSKETAAHDKDDERVPEQVKMTAKQRLKLQLHREQQQKDNNKNNTQPRSVNTSEENEPTISPVVSNVSKELARVMEHSKSHPRMLKSNATSHVWALGALAELLDNAQDRECGAGKVEVDAYVYDGKYVMTVQDDGRGMTRSGLNNMLSFGFSDKEHVSGNVGRFGIGFKSGSMRLADDALILTKRDGYAHAALLSQTFLDSVAADDILIPMFSFTLLEGDGVNYVPFEPSDQSEWTSNTVIFEKYSPFNATTLMKEFDKIQGSHGTRIILFNLRKRENEESHLYELDF